MKKYNVNVNGTAYEVTVEEVVGGAAPAPVAATVAEPAVEDVTDDGELIAVIAAAIAASTGTTTDDFVVRSIKRRY